MKKESLQSQVNRLALFIMNNVPGEPSESEGAIDTAIRLLDKKNLDNLEDVIKIQCSNGNWNYDDYMMGLANGMLLARHIVTGRKDDVPFMETPKKWLKDKPLWFRIKSKLFPNSLLAKSISEDENERLAH